MNLINNIFGASKDEIWAQLEGEINAQFIKRTNFLLNDSKVIVEHKNWTIILDTFQRSTGKSSYPYTRMRCAYVNKDNFKFLIYKEGIFTDIAKYFGMQDIEIADKIFDDKFVLKSKNTEQLRALLKDETIKAHFLTLGQLAHFRVLVKDDDGFWADSFPQGVSELYLEVLGTIKDLASLKLMFMFFAEIMDTLCEIGSAYESRSEITLR